MKNPQIGESLLNLEDRGQSVVVEPASSVDGEAWRFVDNKVILVVFYDFDL